ncbi:MBL fold metallo-hydrolase [Streptomyces anandii]|uniref:MBL fold metallo-hydrolase n=1 Tax=Streptomyces anandii TaxID=285454 RepID=UPI0016730385|nr:MBL fold metallo-hydrolase [Streptomyces anandii]GGY12569.1 MBL fold metallo-hydrolase [Streptomyces anandii JCM 4720]
MAVTAGCVRSTFFGTSSVHVTDGVSGILIDGFFTRPSLLRVALGRPIAPDLRRISDALSRGGVEQLDALFVAHSHHDHVMDSPEVVKRVGGVLHGSESTVNVGRGAGLGEDLMRRISDGDRYVFGDFTVRVFEGAHSPGDRYPGSIDGPLVPPAKASAYRTGGCYSFLFEHPSGTILVHPSANFVPNKFDGLDVDLLYLGIGALGAQSARFQDDYWHHTVEATRPDLVIPVHWDDFGRSLDKKPRPMPRLLDNFARTRELLDRKSTGSGIPVRFQQPYETITPFS